MIGALVFKMLLIWVIGIITYKNKNINKYTTFNNQKFDTNVWIQSQIINTTKTFNTINA